jgi:hypothetical protein
MESTTILSIAAVICYVVYYEIVSASYIEHAAVKSSIVSPEWYFFWCSLLLLSSHFLLS